MEHGFTGLCCRINGFSHLCNCMVQLTMAALMTSESMLEVVLMFFGAGLGTGFIIFIIAYGISSALKIFKNV
jgi:hypothetical protein